MKIRSLVVGVSVGALLSFQAALAHAAEVPNIIWNYRGHSVKIQCAGSHNYHTLYQKKSAEADGPAGKRWKSTAYCYSVRMYDPIRDQRCEWWYDSWHNLHFQRLHANTWYYKTGRPGYPNRIDSTSSWICPHWMPMSSVVRFA